MGLLIVGLRARLFESDHLICWPRQTLCARHRDAGLFIYTSTLSVGWVSL